MSAERIESTLAKLPGFCNLSEHDRGALAHACQLRTYSAGDALIRQGDRGHGLFLVLDGEVGVELADGDETVDLGTRGPGDFVGVLAMIDHRPRSATAVARGEVSAAYLGDQVFESLAHRHAAIAYPLQKALARQLAGTFRRVAGRLRSEHGAG
jgi:cAMP-dependent protein kinase regulator